MNRILAAGVLAMSLATALVAQTQSVAKVKEIKGSLSVLRTDAQDWRDAKPNMPLKVGDQLYCREESFAAIEYASGVVLRMDELTKVTLAAASEKGTVTTTPGGNVWVNMRKLVTKGSEFELSSPTATAAIRGTVFSMATAQDSSTDVAVFTGKVAVGPSDQLKQTIQRKKSTEAPTEVPGPEEIPGPYEVSLDQWRSIVAGQMISVRKDGKFTQKEFSAQQQAQKDAFVKKNLEMDAALDSPLPQRKERDPARPEKKGAAPKDGSGNKPDTTTGGAAADTDKGADTLPAQPEGQE